MLPVSWPVNATQAPEKILRIWNGEQMTGSEKYARPVEVKSSIKRMTALTIDHTRRGQY